LTAQNPVITLRPFQQRVFEMLSAGKSVVLQAPTGAGKTRAALYPFLHWLSQSLVDPQRAAPLPPTCRYAVPLRVLASQFYREYQEADKNLDGFLGTNLQSVYQRFDQALVQVQTGEQPSDPQFESALTFCTIDQLLASFLGIPYGLGGRRAHLNVGAIIGAYLVLDEFHLYPLAKDGRGCWGARTTTLQMLELLSDNQRRLAPFVLMTATFSSDLLATLADLLGAQVVRIESQAELDEIDEGRERRFTVHNAPMQSGLILDTHRDCSLVVCNTVLRAQQMYLDLCEEARTRGHSTRIELLHSRFTDEHRRKKQVLVERQLGKQAWDKAQYLGEDVIIVATQVVEVGLDISVRTLHSEGAPANSIIQRAGRCARFGGQQGQVHLYPLAEGESHRPYDSARTVATLAAFHAFDQQPVGFNEEQQVIDAVHTSEDRTLLEQYHKERLGIRSRIFEGLAQHDRSLGTQLIRDDQQVTLLIHDSPNDTITERPWEWQTFSLHPGTLESRWQTLLQAATAARGFADDGPIAWQAQIDEDSAGEQNERRVTRYRWEPVTTATKVRLALILALSPDVATYSSEFGFVLRDGRLPLEWPEQPFRSEAVAARGGTRKQGFDYSQESYAEHIGGLLHAYYYSRLAADLRFIARRLELAAGLSPGSLDQALRLAIGCHDIAKLGEGWQRWASEWQVLLAHTAGAQYGQHKAPLAHTDYDPRLHRGLQKQVRSKRPPHACESAWLAKPFIAMALGNKELHENPLARAVVAAIAHHHGAGSQAYKPIRLIPGALAAIREGLDMVLEGNPLSYDLAELETVCDAAGSLDDPEQLSVPSEGRIIETWLYYVIVRALILADNRSFVYR